MKGLKPTFISILAIGLLAGSAVGVAAQDEATDPMAPSWFTWEDAGVGPPEISEDPDTGLTLVTVQVEATDPRASGTATNLEDFAHDKNDERYRVGGTSLRLDNDGGAWVGTSRLVDAVEVGLGGAHLMGSFAELTGEGDYEGLTMFMFRMFGPEGFERPMQVGFIVPTDTVPTMPPAPAAE